MHAAYLRITTTALSLHTADEPRTLSQLRTDGVTPAGIGAGIRATVNITVPVLTLMDHSEEPGHLEGYGPIDPDTARRLTGGAAGFTRLLTHPETGVVLSVGRDHYPVPTHLKRWLRLRDETCRFPGCTKPAAHSDLDHSLDWQFNGLTAHDNLAHLCPGCHALKSETGWTVRHLDNGLLQWTSPTGRTFTTEPATLIQTTAPDRGAAPTPPSDPRPDSVPRTEPDTGTDPAPF